LFQLKTNPITLNTHTTKGGSGWGGPGVQTPPVSIGRPMRFMQIKAFGWMKGGRGSDGKYTTT